MTVAKNPYKFYNGSYCNLVHKMYYWQAILSRDFDGYILKSPLSGVTLEWL